MKQIRAPFTPAQVKALWRYQRANVFHPFTCANRGDGNHFDNGIDLGGLIPTVNGWICQCCDYRQAWAHDFMCDTRTVLDAEDAMKAMMTGRGG